LSRNRGPEGGSSRGPVRELTLTVILTGLALILSAAIGHLPVLPVLLASCIVLCSVLLGTNLSYQVLSREFQSPIGSGEIEERLSLIDARLADISRSRPQNLIADQHYSQIEAADTTRGVVICKQNMGSEFDPEPARRDSLISYDRIVSDNISRGVRYHWIAPDSDVNQVRADIIRRRFSPDRANILLLDRRDWQELPFSLETVFILALVEGRQHIEGFIQVPVSENLQERSWIKMQPDIRDAWFGSVRRYIGESFFH
jgi:hypothetical protein